MQLTQSGAVRYDKRMIAHLSGTILSFAKGSLILDVHGVGYRVNTRAESLDRLAQKSGESISLFTHLAVREESLDLYGFETEAERSFFVLLITVPGIGPKSALGILNVTDISTLSSAIIAGNSTYLTKVSGIGKKTAQKIVIELRDKLEYAAKEPETLSDEASALEALHALGYSMPEAREALRAVSQDAVGTNEKIKAALKILGK